MDRKKIIYIGIITIITVITSITYFSYAFFINKDEQHGKLNVTVGTLNYKIKSSYLSNNSISLSAYETKKFEIEITSLNSIESKYELYYIGTNVEVGYSNSSVNNPVGTIGANAKKKITVRITNLANANKTVTFKVVGGLIGNTLSKSEGNSIPSLASLCTIPINKIYAYDYYQVNGVGKPQTLTVACSGVYKLEVWGAQGGYSSVDTEDTRGGYGGYSVGEINLNKNRNLYIVVGGKGKPCNVYGNTTAGTTTCGDDGGYNGGGSTRQYVSNTFYGSGGGATHIATVTGELASLSTNQSAVLIVAGGGGGASRYYPNHEQYNSPGGDAGGYIGSIGAYTRLDRNVTCTGGTQLAAGTGSDTSGEGFGHGGNMTRYVGPGGGSGWYGGGTSEVISCGGSSYIGNNQLINKKMVCYNCTPNTNAATYTETNNCAQPVANENCSKKENGYAKITFIED